MRTMGSILPPTKIEEKSQKSQIFFHHSCDAITDVIFLYVSTRFLDAIFLKKKTFDSMQFRLRLPSPLVGSR